MTLSLFGMSIVPSAAPHPVPLWGTEILTPGRQVDWSVAGLIDLVLYDSCVLLRQPAQRGLLDGADCWDG